MQQLLGGGLPQGKRGILAPLGAVCLAAAMAIIPLAGDAAEAEPIRVHIGANVKGDLPWDFWAATSEVRVRPGEPAQVTYRVRNRGPDAATGKAFHATTPGEAEGFVEIIGCFCDEAMRLEPGEERTLTLVFRVRWEIPEGIRDLLVEYDFWPASPEELEKARRAPAAAPQGPERK